MTIDERRKYLRIMQPRYLAASRADKGRLLDEMEQVTDLNRKVLIRLLRSDLQRRPRSRERGSVYGAAVQDAIRVIYETLDYPCAERLTPALAATARHLASHGELTLTTDLEELLSQISISTVKRIQRRITQDQPRPRRKGAVSVRPLTQGVPMLRLPWNEQHPGFLEGDLVHHCGPSTTGDYVYTLQLVDIATAWSERVALLGRSFLVMEDGFRRILARIPFLPQAIHVDNGAEFLNYHLFRFFEQVLPEVQLSRSRPRNKNDNRFVEQKNSTLVRAYLGQERLDSVAQTCALNRIYDQMWLYYNFFQPAMRLVEKEVLPLEGGVYRVKRHYDKARTPLERLYETGVLTQARREYLEALYDQTNPRRLRQAIHDAIEQLFDLPGAAPGQSEDVRLTLYTVSRPDDSSSVTLSFDPTTTLR